MREDRRQLLRQLLPGEPNCRSWGRGDNSPGGTDPTTTQVLLLLQGQAKKSINDINPKGTSFWDKRPAAIFERK